MDINKKIIEANQGLKAIFSKTTIARKNKKLYLRAKLPPKQGQEVKGIQWQYIALGLDATEENLLRSRAKTSFPI